MMSKKKKRIWPTEIIIFHTFILATALSVFFLNPHDVIPVIITICYSIISIIVYWIIKLKLKNTGALNELWKRHVIDPNINRISKAIVVYVLDLSHVLLLFGGLFLIIGNCLFYLNDHTTTLEWFQAIVYAIQCMGLQTNREYAAPGIMGVLLTIVASLLGRVFTAVWVTIFMGAFDIIFKKPLPKDGNKEVGGEI